MENYDLTYLHQLGHGWNNSVHRFDESFQIPGVKSHFSDQKTLKIKEKTIICRLQVPDLVYL